MLCNYIYLYLIPMILCALETSHYYRFLNWTRLFSWAHVCSSRCDMNGKSNLAWYWGDQFNSYITETVIMVYIMLVVTIAQWCVHSVGDMRSVDKAIWQYIIAYLIHMLFLLCKDAWQLSGHRRRIQYQNSVFACGILFRYMYIDQNWKFNLLWHVT